jgi:hypothetical protein
MIKTALDLYTGAILLYFDHEFIVTCADLAFIIIFFIFCIEIGQELAVW